MICIRIRLYYETHMIQVHAFRYALWGSLGPMQEHACSMHVFTFFPRFTFLLVWWSGAYGGAIRSCRPHLCASHLTCFYIPCVLSFLLSVQNLYYCYQFSKLIIEKNSTGESTHRSPSILKLAVITVNKTLQKSDQKLEFIWTETYILPSS